MESLKQEYIEQLKVMFPELVGLKNILLSEGGADAALRLSIMAHTLLGLGTTVGFPAISETGRRLCHILDIQDQRREKPELQRFLNDFEDACRRAIVSESIDGD